MRDLPGQTLRIGIAGLGTVGVGVIRLLETNRDLIAARAGRPIEVSAVSARDSTKDRGVDLSPYGWEDDMTALAKRDDVDLVLELVGGIRYIALCRLLRDKKMRQGAKFSKQRAAQ